VLMMLDQPASIPVLEEIDLLWSTIAPGGKHDGLPAWKERHRERIEEACLELGVRCKVDRNDSPLVFALPEL
jgi:hypothetical protein